MAGAVTRWAAAAAATGLLAACSAGGGAPPPGPVRVGSGDVSLSLAVAGPPAGGAAEGASGGAAGDTVVLVHGGPGLSRQAMAPFEVLASEGHRVASYDQRGAGESTRPADGDYGLAAHVADLEAVRRALGADRVALVGQSWGGLVAAAYAARHPDRVDALVLVAAAPPDRAAFVRGQERFAARLRALQDRGLVPAPLPEAPEGSCAALAAVLPVYAADPTRPPAEPAGTTCSAATARETYADALDADALAAVAEGLAAYDGPVLALTGERDPFGLEWLDAVVAALPQAERLVVPGAGHLVALERPDVVLPAVAGFLEEQ